MVAAPHNAGPAVNRRRDAAASGHAGYEATARELRDDQSAAVRATALGALARMGAITEHDLSHGLRDSEPLVRRRACQISARFPNLAGADVLDCLNDADLTVVEVAAWALGERGTGTTEIVERLSSVATTHEEPLCRESAVAALGALGDERGLPAILVGTRDRATVRRRAVIALAPFSGPEVDAALALAKDDKDWQVRQAAEDLS